MTHWLFSCVHKSSLYREMDSSAFQHYSWLQNVSIFHVTTLGLVHQDQDHDCPQSILGQFWMTSSTNWAMIRLHASALLFRQLQNEFKYSETPHLVEGIRLKMTKFSVNWHKCHFQGLRLNPCMFPQLPFSPTCCISHPHATFVTLFLWKKKQKALRCQDLLS